MNERVFQETFMRPFMCLSAFSLLVGNLDKKKKKSWFEKLCKIFFR